MRTSKWGVDFVSVQSSGALQQQIDRCEVRDHRVKIQVQALLYNLCGNQNHSFWSVRIGSRTIFAEGLQALEFASLPVGHGIAGVKQHHGYALRVVLEGRVKPLRPIHRIDNAGHATLFMGQLEQFVSNAGVVLRDSLEPDLLFGTGWNVNGIHLAIQNSGDARIGLFWNVFCSECLKKCGSFVGWQGRTHHDHARAEGVQPTHQ